MTKKYPEIIINLRLGNDSIFFVELVELSLTLRAIQLYEKHTLYKAENFQIVNEMAMEKCYVNVREIAGDGYFGLQIRSC